MVKVRKRIYLFFLKYFSDGAGDSTQIGLSRWSKMSVALKCILLSASFLFCIIVIPSHFSYAVPTHFDKKNVKGACGDCHKGHGKKGTSMLTRSKEDFCFLCHSLSGKASDIYSELSKPSNHRIQQTAQYHVQGEELPEIDPSAPRHASCNDCHNIHKSDKNDRFKGLNGYSGSGGRVRQVTRDYELCYNCHSVSANLVSEKSNVSVAFRTTNPSYHPVESYGRNSFVPSLKRGRSESSTVNCSDCHGNNDPFGPKGPHGSIYEPILKYRYIRLPGAESPISYELCYSCHDRTSILNDESFKAHKAHIVHNQNSCAQCHDAHGSRFYPSLIKFDTTTVFPNSKGELTFQAMTQGRPRCYLSCHVNGQVYEHKLDKNLVYTINTRLLNQW